jgi:hypothetical protein
MSGSGVGVTAADYSRVAMQADDDIDNGAAATIAAAAAAAAPSAVELKTSASTALQPHPHDYSKANARERIDVRRSRYPYSIIWGPLPCITWILPFIGHLGIADSQGRVHDFAVRAIQQTNVACMHARGIEYLSQKDDRRTRLCRVAAAAWQTPLD